MARPTVVHVGPPKTGTTSVQSFLACRGVPFYGLHDAPSQAVKRAVREGRVPPLPDGAILSDEEITLAAPPGQVVALLAAAGADRIVATTREPGAWLESLYWHDVRGAGEVVPWEAWLPHGKRRLARYRAIVEAVERHPRGRVVTLETMASDVAPLCEAFALPKAHGPLPRENRRISVREVRWLRWKARLGVQREVAPLLPPALAERIMAWLRRGKPAPKPPAAGPAVPGVPEAEPVDAAGERGLVEGPPAPSASNP